MRYPWCACLVLAGWAAWAAGAPVKQYQIETVAGSADLGDGGQALAAEFGNIQAVALDASGNLYLSDTDHHRVRKVAADGTVATIAGTGIAGFSGDGAPATAAQVNLPYGIAAGPTGEVYVADLGNHRVRRIARDGVISTVAGNGSCGSTGDGGPAAMALLCAPRNLLLDKSGNLYISEFDGHRVRRVSPDGTIFRVAGTGKAGFSGDGSVALLAQLAFPSGLALDRWGALYIADSQNQRIRRVTPDGLIDTVLGGAENISLLTPSAVAIDRNTVIYVADHSYSVRAYLPSRAWITVAGTGTAAFGGDGGPAASAPLTSANDLAVGPTGELYIADGMRIRRIDNDAVIQTVAGDGYVRAVEAGGSAAGARLFHPSAVALDGLGHLYIADTGTQRVRKLSLSGSIETLTGTGLAGFAGENLPAPGASMDSPMGVALDAAGNVIIAETGNHRIRRVDREDRLSTAAGTGAPGRGLEYQRAAETALRAPRGVCTGADQAWYILDSGNHRVLGVGPDGRVVLVAGSGTPGFSGDSGPARGAQLNQPAACALDKDGRLLIADTLNHRIRRLTADGTISTVAGTGTPGVSGDDGPAAAARLSAPSGIAVDAGGSLYISDTGNHRIRQVTPDGIIHTIAGGDANGFGGDGGPARTALLDSPGGLAVDPSGDLYFADTGNNRVRRLRPESEPAPPPPLVQLSVVNAASLLEGPVAPGEILSIFGDGLGPAEGVAGLFDPAGNLATQAGGAEVRFDGAAAPIFYAQAGQINLQVPYTVAGAAQTEMEISYNRNLVGRRMLPVAEASPALFPVAANQDGSPNSALEPAPRGSIVTFYGTGDGLTDGMNHSGRSAQFPYPRPTLPVTVSVAGITADVLYAGSAPELVGVFQVNARIPGGFVPPGPAAVVVKIGAASSPVLHIWLR